MNVIDGLYAGMLDEATWHSALERLTDAVSGSALLLFSIDPSSGAVFRADTRRIDPSVMAGYQDTWIHHDPRHAAGLTCPVGEAQIDGMLMNPRDFERSAVLNEFLGPADVPFHLATWLERRATRGVVLTVLGSWSRGRFDEEERRRMQILVPHVRRAVEMKDRMARDGIEAEGMLEVMDRLPYGLLLLGAGLEILEASQVARDILSVRSVIHADGRRLGFIHASDARAFAERLREDPVRAAPSDALVLSRGNTRAPMSLLILPLHPTREAWLRPAARWLVLIFDPENTRSLDEQSLRLVFRLTAAEAALAKRLAEGLTVAQAATELAISINTARTQLKSVFARMGVRSQAQLVRRLVTGPAAMARKGTRASR